MSQLPPHGRGDQRRGGTDPRAADTEVAARGRGGVHQRVPFTRTSTQTVFGEGLGPRLMLVGEQPATGRTSRATRSSGRRAGFSMRLSSKAGNPRADAYVTNVVKHFKWTPRASGGSTRSPPHQGDQERALPWLAGRARCRRPRATVVCLGSDRRNRAVIGSKARVMKDHGELLESKLGRTAMPTLHPSAILRADPEDRDDAMAMLVGTWAVARRPPGSLSTTRR